MIRFYQIFDIIATKSTQERALFDKIKKNIILKDQIYYFDYTASGLAYKPIEDSLNLVLKTYANTHSDSCELAKTTSEYYENARLGLKKLLSLSSNFYLLPCGYGSTGAIKKFQEIMGIYLPPKTKKRLNLENKTQNLPLVIVGPYEHHSNEVSFRQGLCEVVRIALDENGEIDYKELEKVAQNNQNREIIASFSVASNVTGVLSDYKKIYKIIKKFNGILALDAASFSAYDNVDCEFCDAIFYSPHKLLGGVGSCGLLAIKKDLCKEQSPTFAGGGTVGYVSRTSQIFTQNYEELEQAGTPPIIQLIKAYEAFKLRNKIGLDNIKIKENELKIYFEEKLLKIPNLILYSPLNLDRLPIYSFNIKGINPYEVSEILSSKFNIQTRAGCSCAGPYGHDLLGLMDNQKLEQKPGWVRISLHYTHDFSDLDYLLSAINSISTRKI